MLLPVRRRRHSGAGDGCPAGESADDGPPANAGDRAEGPARVPGPGLPVPVTWRALLDELAPVFKRRSTHALFVALACGMILASRRTVVAVAAAAGIAGQFRRACWFFSRAVWDADDLGVAVARLIVRCLLPVGEPVTVAIDGTFFIRWGRKGAQARWAYDGSAQGGTKIALGPPWGIAALVVRVPVCSAPGGLPVLFRLWRGKGTASQAELAAQMLTTLTAAFPGRLVHGVGDAAFHGQALIRPGSTWTTRLPASQDRQARPATQERHPAGHPGPDRAQRRQAARDRPLLRHGHHDAGHHRGRAVVRQLHRRSRPGCPGEEPDSAKPYDLAIFTLDTAATTAAVIERYSWRWPIEPSNAAGKQITGVGDACNRVTAAVERTVPFGFLVQSLLICWYTRSGYHPADVTRRRLLCPWYRTKTEPSVADMLTRLRREFLKARFSAIRPGHTPLDQIEDYAWTCDIPAA